MPDQYLISERDGAVEYLTLNRPEVRNAFDDAVIAELTDWTARTAGAAVRHEVRAVVLAGAGKAFCAGADAAWMARSAGYSESDNLREAAAAARMYRALDELPVPLIGRVHGAAIGGGAGLVAVCDIVLAEVDAVFGFTEVKLGILPATISPFVVAKIGVSAARELFLTGARFSAVRAHALGLVHAVLPEAELDAGIETFLREILSAAPGAVAAAKQLVRDVAGRPAADVAALTASAIARRRVSPEGQEGLKAFLEKRKPSWSSGS
jgi:methylglutaconyl-CoA hydratase